MRWLVIYYPHTILVSFVIQRQNEQEEMKPLCEVLLKPYTTTAFYGFRITLGQVKAVRVWMKVSWVVGL